MKALLVISAQRPDLYEEALRTAGEDIEVVLDRRVGDRRRPGRPFENESKRNDRRRIRIDDKLQTQGWALVTAEAREAIPAHAPLSMDLGMSGLDDAQGPASPG
jgi:hypothetical protein